jgi:glycosyltransferase involved in cell wall biosynthesis
MRPVLRKINQWMLRTMLKRAAGAAFVTERFLQDQYLATDQRDDPAYVKAHYSSIELKPDWFCAPLRFDAPLTTVRMVHISNSIDNDIKGHQPALRVLRKLHDLGLDASLSFIGDGSAVGQLKAMASALGIEGHVHFIGRIHDRAALLACLRAFDLFLYPTRLEGLPRAVIEAMAVGLPTLSTPIAGIPELLAPAYMFTPDDVEGFAHAIARLCRTPQELTAMSAANVATARKFDKATLDARRAHFYRSLRTLAGAGTP